MNVASLQAVLLATLPRIIAVNWEPEGDKNQLDATVTNVLTRLSAQASTNKPQATQIKMGILRSAVRQCSAVNAFGGGGGIFPSAVNATEGEAAQAAQAGSTRSSKGVEVACHEESV